MTYSITNDLLVSTTKNVDHVGTTKKSGKIKPTFLVIHYTAGATYKADVTTLSSSDVQASCHLVLSKDGKWTQIGDFTDKLWHAGKSTWKGINGLNGYSIGIEVSCEGMVDYVRTESDGSKIYRTWFGSELSTKNVDIIDAVHPNGGPQKGWVQFTPEQIKQVIEVGTLLMRHYGLKEAIGHDMIAPGRKTDPGPCMPKNVYAILNGRQEDTGNDEEEDLGTIVANEDKPSSTPVVEGKTRTVSGVGKSGLNLRNWPAKTSKVQRVLKEGEKVQFIRGTWPSNDWSQVKTSDGLTGWVFSSYLK